MRRSRLFAAALVSVLAVPTPPSSWAAPLERPNILFIAIDDQNDWIGALGGHPRVQTPRIDALASRGTLFTNAHAQAPLCNPSRTSLMFSLRPSTTGIYGLSPWLLDLEPWKDAVSLPGLPERDGLEGISLVPQLKDASAPRERPAITTHNHDNHAVRSERWRYIRYADGSEELYDLLEDPNEWHNLAADPALAAIIEEHRRWLPGSSAKPAPGSRHRILTYEDGVAAWEGNVIGPDDPIPEI